MVLAAIAWRPVALGLVVVALVAPQEVTAAAVGHYPAGAEEGGAQGRANVAYALERIPTATGKTAFQRMQACGFEIHWDTSWVARQAVNVPAYGTSAGDVTVQVIFDRKSPDPASGKGLMARWFIQKGRPSPSSGWAKLIQTSPYPMQVEGARPC